MPVKFCKECNNMLYPMEDRTYLQETGERRMLYACRNCSHREVAEDLGVPVYRNVVTSNNRLQRGKFLQMYDVWLDPTLRRTRSTQCSQCGNREAVYFMGPVGRNDTAIVLYFVCTNCKHQWSTADEQN